MCGTSSPSVGRIVCQEIQPPEAVVEGANTPTPLDPQSTKVHPGFFASVEQECWPVILTIIAEVSGASGSGTLAG